MKPELPPTAGLPVTLRDYLQKPLRPLADALVLWPGLASPILTSSGTAALCIALSALAERKPKRRAVIIPAYTCPLVPLAICKTPGLRPLICDTAPNSFDFDPDKLQRLCGPDTLAVIPTHLGGRVADVPTARAIAAQCGAYVIEDAAQALGAFAGNANGGQSVGLAGEAGFFSLAAGKGLTTYEGGILTSRDPELAEAFRRKAERLPKTPLRLTLLRNLELAGYALLYNPRGLAPAYGLPLRKRLARGDEAAAVGDIFDPEAIAAHRLDPLRLRVAANAGERLRRHLDHGVRQALPRLAECEAAGLAVIRDRPGDQGVWPFFMLLPPTKEQRDQALRALWRAGQGVSKLFVHALPDYDYLAPCLNPRPESAAYSNARDLAERMLTISNTAWLDEKTFNAILAVITESRPCT